MTDPNQYVTRNTVHRYFARFATAAILIFIVSLPLAQRIGWVSASARGSQMVEPGPQGAIYSMVNAARAGNVEDYLANFAGTLGAELRRTSTESTAARFADYLRGSVAGINGVAVGDPQAMSSNRCAVRVEFLFSDRNEAQTMYLERQASAWRIERIESSQREQPLIPYGTPVRSASRRSAPNDPKH